MALALLSGAPSPDPSPQAAPETSVRFRLRPPLDRVLDFALDLDAEAKTGGSGLTFRLLVAQRARAEGANFRLSRYVTYSTARGTGPLAAAVGVATGLEGRTFPLLLDADGREVRTPRRRYENAPDDLPSFAIGIREPMAVGTAVALPKTDLRPAGRATLREVREGAFGRAAVLALETKTAEMSGGGTLVVSIEDGMLLLADLAGETTAFGMRPASRVRVAIRRQNVPGLDRLATDLGFRHEAGR